MIQYILHVKSLFFKKLVQLFAQDSSEEQE